MWEKGPSQADESCKSKPLSTQAESLSGKIYAGVNRTPNRVSGDGTKKAVQKHR
jgi:hypothetical protein